MSPPRMKMPLPTRGHWCTGRAGRRPHVDIQGLSAPFSAINAGLESFAESLTAQGAGVVHVDWRPPAGGNEKLMGILARLKSK